MDTTILEDPHLLRARFAHNLASADDIWIATVWATTATSVAEPLWQVRLKLRALVVGLDFHQTEPAFLRRFGAFLRVGTAGAMTFHPKVYLFRTGRRFACILGSSNLTAGGFGDNVEINTYITGRTSERFFRQLLRRIENLWAGARRLSRAERQEYERTYEQARKYRERFSHFRMGAAGKAAAEIELRREAVGLSPPSDLDVEWPKYFKLLFAQEDDGARGWIRIRETREHRGYLGVIRVVAAAFRRYRTLAAMPLESRRQVAGLQDGFLYFGSMLGAGTFKHLVAQKPRSLDVALNAIPARGPVKRQDYDRFIGKLPPERIGVATATRLLAMKRPDVFLCVDSENRRQLAEAFGLSQVSLTNFDGYWDLLTLIWRCGWYASRRPRRRNEAEVWDGRVAMLDAFYYGR